MIPSVDARLLSVVRALTDVVLPSLPAEAGLAQEQIQLAIGHLQILRAQFDDTLEFEAGELADTAEIGKALAGLTGGAKVQAASAALKTALAGADDARKAGEIRTRRAAINGAIAELVAAVSADGEDESRTALRRIILEKEKARIVKDRRWAAPFGFDSLSDLA